MRWFPLLDIPKAIADADQCLKDLSWYIECLHQESDGQYPPPEQAATLLANAAALRELLPFVIPSPLKEEILEEQRRFDEEADRWESSGY